MLNSSQGGAPTARINIKLDLHTGGSVKRVDLPFKVLVLN